MALEQKLSLKLAQRLVMTPSLQQAIKLLQLSRLELEETLAEEILENPVLDVEIPGEEEAASVGEADGGSSGGETAEEGGGEGSGEEELLPTAEEAYADIDVEAFFADYLADGRPEGPSMALPSADQDLRLENVVSAGAGLYDHLLWQVHLLDCSHELAEVCEFIIGNLDEDGFLRASDDEIIHDTGCGDRTLDEGLRLVRSLDPPGIAARTLQECLEAQVLQLIDAAADDDEREGLDLVLRIVAEHWNLFLHQKWDALAAAVDCAVVAELKPVLLVIQDLEPKPGRIYRQERNQYIEPDVYIRNVDGTYAIALNDDGLPRLRINSRYARMLKTKDLDKHAGDYLREKMRSAMWLMKSIDQRQRTIYKVAKSIVDFQKGFLDHGIEHLKPMVLRQVAEDIGMHESTISRVVSNKYMHTPRGLFPMKYFFHSGVDSARGDNVSSVVVKERIRKVVEGENSSHPLSDSKIMRMLQNEGIRLARRTVAKYREELMIPSSDKRKKVF
ncbi:MAG: RNA polymerase factor sigma-54 [Thermoanaerobaculales bacterium]